MSLTAPHIDDTELRTTERNVHMRTVITFLALTTLLVLAACSQATPDPKNLTDPFFLDTYSSSGIPMVVGPVLEENGLYSVTVEGTHSSWTVDEWDLGVCQGTPETLPMFETPNVWNGRVGMDAVWVFAAPNGSSRGRCPCGCHRPRSRVSRSASHSRTPRSLRPAAASGAALFALPARGIAGFPGLAVSERP